MITIALSIRWTIGRFVIHQRPRPDNPHFAVYIVSLKDREIGRSFSIPDRDCCEWLLHHPDGHYAPTSATRVWSYRALQRKGGRPSRAEVAARRAAEPEEVT